MKYATFAILILAIVMIGFNITMIDVNNLFQGDSVIALIGIVEKEFVCNLNACKGQCCIDGDAGAPLDKEETQILEDIFPLVEPYLRAESIESIKEQGTWIIGQDGGYETPLLNQKECAYVIFKDEMALCAIEQAYNDGKVAWKKPISCHLYPIRIKEYSQFSAVNYHKWHICDDACTLGKELQVPVYKFLKEPLIRKYGQGWYDELELVIKEWNNYSR